MKAIVTGAAGFIGSSLSERLLAEGWQVIGIDCFTDYYDVRIKKDNLKSLLNHKSFTFIEEDLLTVELNELMQDCDYIFHQAAQAGVRASWGKSFEIYTRNNIEATQRLLEEAKNHPLQKFVYASSSSVYGEVKSFPMKESAYPQPVSPYGVSKLAAEHLCVLYYKNFGVPTASLRYFTVYGPRQRPDMAFHKFIKAMLKGEEIAIYGDGAQTRDFTFISDAVAANLAAALKGTPGGVYNVGGGARISVNEVLALLERITARPANIKYIERQKGDVTHTAADISLAQAELGYQPVVRIEDGLTQAAAWLKEKLGQGLL